MARFAMAASHEVSPGTLLEWMEYTLEKLDGCGGAA
jgi:hypothetical protein